MLRTRSVTCACTSFAALLVLVAGGCQMAEFAPEEIVTSLPAAEAWQRDAQTCGCAYRIDLADQETEGFHFWVPKTMAAIDHWTVELIPDDPAAPVVGLKELRAKYYLTPRLYDCITVNDPLAPSARNQGPARKPASEHVPDALVPMRLDGDAFRSSLPAGDARAMRHVWVEITRAEMATATDGPRSGNLHLAIRGYHADGVRATDLALTAALYSFTLPVQGEFKTMVNWNTTVAGYFEWEKISPELRHKYYEFFLRYRLSPTSFRQQEMEPSLEDLAFCAQHGLNCLNLYTLGRQKGPLPQEESDRIAKIAAAAKADLEKFGLANSAFLLVCNSADESDVESITANADALHKEVPWAKVWLFAGPNEALSQKVDAWSTLTLADTRAFDAISYSKESRQKFATPKDLHLWYVGQEPLPPNVNLLLSNTPFDAHVLGLQTWANQLDGLVIPHATLWPWGRAQAMDFPAREWQSRKDGLGVLCYPMPDGAPCPSVRLVNLRDGIEHAEALREAENLVYNLDLRDKAYNKFVIPAIEDKLKSFNATPEGMQQRQPWEEKMAEALKQREQIPAAKQALEMILKEYREGYQPINRVLNAEDAEKLSLLRRRLYRAIAPVSSLVEALDLMINSLVAPPGATGMAATATNEIALAPGH